ncbi:MAG: penicillin-binding protein 2 [Actinobacteria bacterium]|nr:penicillin-binding protein 2 [Actinomycetota bacterium]MBW3649258.1 penicillin-binding protein 2 [Actinomycetota bacterium]
MSTDSSRLRLAVLGVMVVSLFSALFARLWYLQVLDSDTFVAAATTNHIRLVHEDAPRGRILDRNGNVLVDNRRSQAITVNRNLLSKRPDGDEVKARLAALLGITREDLDRRIADVRYSQYKPIPVAEDVPEELYVYVKEHQEELPGVEATIVSQRTYPNGPLAAHVLGYVGEINDRELDERKRSGYRLGESIGKSGAELMYEEILRGEPGVTKLQVNATGEVVKGEPLARRPPSPGRDVSLTLDLHIQRLAEESLQQGLEAARLAADREHRKRFLAPAGSVVVLDPSDGGVLAMASYPTYNPGDFVNGIKPDVFATLTDPANHFPLNNRAVQGQYAPGSTFKLITAVAAMQKGMIAGNTSITDEGSFRVPNCRGERCVFSNAGKHPWGRVDLRRAISVSSDVYFYNLGARFWIERGRFGNGIQDTARLFGFGEKSGIPLASEKAGVIPDPERKKRLNEEKPQVFPEGRWFTGDNVNMAIGQGDVLVTPLQLANAYAAFANGGTLFEPRLGLGDPPKPLREVGLTPAMRQPILEGLLGAVSTEDGTASAAFSGFPHQSFPLAGKTGTAQVRGKQDSALFAAFGPVSAPRYAVAVVLEEAGFGGSAAAPVARRIIEGTLGPPPTPVRLGSGND